MIISTTEAENTTNLKLEDSLVRKSISSSKRPTTAALLVVDPTVFLCATSAQQHPNDYVRASTLRFLRNSPNTELLDPLISLRYLSNRNVGDDYALLAGANLMEVDFALKKDWALFSCGQNSSLSSYHPVKQQSTSSRAYLIIQLVSAALIVILLDELLQKATAYILASNSSSPPTSAKLSSRMRSHRPLSKLAVDPNSKGAILEEEVTERHKPHRNHCHIFVIYLQGFHIEIPVKSNRFCGQRGTYPVKLFYKSSMPIMLEFALTSNVFVTQMLASCFLDNFFVKLLGVWEPMEDSPQLAATSKITYYMSPPHTMKEAFLTFHTAIYIMFMFSTCALFSKTGIEVSGSGPRDVAQQMTDQQMVMSRHCEGSMYKELERVISTEAAFDGVILGLLSVAANMLGAMRSGLESRWPSLSSTAGNWYARI
ncbi:hypothetical protein D9615_009464 [Tricholomella constricta]|uniref:Uncharacterized protein n=1 Tax=Tricholomella constricta TaxID=117010 RepID=A0A8H5LXR8_9AGAR|nr:hypothetical protein D9615_009464 [Tricholomella constricta]